MDVVVLTVDQDASREGTDQVPAAPTEVVSARFTPDGKSMATTTRDRIIRIWPLSGGPPRTRPAHPAAC